MLGARTPHPPASPPQTIACLALSGRPPLRLPRPPIPCLYRFRSPLAPSLRGARVLELGAGKCGLAGLGVAVGSEAAEVVITDGNPDAVENLQVRTYYS